MIPLKSKLFFFCFLFISCSINASINPIRSYVIKYQHSDYAVSAGHKKEKKQLDQLEYILHSFFRLNKSATPNFQDVKNAHLLLTVPGFGSFSFSKQYYSYYTAKHLHCISSFPLYLSYRRLLI